MTVNRIKRNGSYAPLSAHYYKDDAVDEAGEAAELLYVRGLAFCAEILSDGFISDRQLARFVGVGMFDAAERAETLVKVGLWGREDGGYRIRSWLDWNRSREEITEQQSKDADRKRRSTGANNPDRTPPDGSHKPSERNPDGVTTDNRTESQGSHSLARPGARPGAPPRAHALDNSTLDNSTPGGAAPRKRGARLPDGWDVTPELVDWCRQRCPNVDGRTETERFVNHFLAAPGQKGVKLDWARTWKNWMLEEQKRAERRPAHLRPVPDLAPPTPTDPDTALADLRERAAAPEAACLLGRAYIEPPQPLADDTDPYAWSAARAVEWIDHNEQDIRAALTARRTG